MSSYRQGFGGEPTMRTSAEMGMSGDEVDAVLAS